MQPLRVFIGYDERQPVSYSVLQHSINSSSSRPVVISPLILKQLPITRQGLTPFTFSRFLVPYLCEYKGWALFLDIDMIVDHDIAELFALADDRYKVMVSKNPKRFEWASAMLFNCAKCEILSPEYVSKADKLHAIGWAAEHEIGDLPPEWNHLVGYDRPRSDAKLIHFTQGIPAYDETKDSEYAARWHYYHRQLNYTQPWAELMGQSVHAAELPNGVKVPKFAFEAKLKEYLKEHGGSNGDGILPQAATHANAGNAAR
jgi:hypothetical protein